jgi:hypothetical protein
MYYKSNRTNITVITVKIHDRQMPLCNFESGCSIFFFLIGFTHFFYKNVKKEST